MKFYNFSKKISSITPIMSLSERISQNRNSNNTKTTRKKDPLWKNGKYY